MLTFSVSSDAVKIDKFEPFLAACYKAQCFKVTDWRSRRASVEGTKRLFTLTIIKLGLSLLGLWIFREDAFASVTQFCWKHKTLLQSGERERHKQTNTVC